MTFLTADSARSEDSAGGSDNVNTMKIKNAILKFDEMPEDVWKLQKSLSNMLGVAVVVELTMSDGKKLEDEWRIEKTPISEGTLESVLSGIRFSGSPKKRFVLFCKNAIVVRCADIDFPEDFTRVKFTRDIAGAIACDAIPIMVEWLNYENSFAEKISYAEFTYSGKNRDGKVNISAGDNLYDFLGEISKNMKINWIIIQNNKKEMSMIENW